MLNEGKDVSADEFLTPACGVGTCIRPEHMYRVSQKDASRARRAGMDLRDLLDHERPYRMLIPLGEGYVDGSTFNSFTDPYGRAMASMIWYCYKAIKDGKRAATTDEDGDPVVTVRAKLDWVEYFMEMAREFVVDEALIEAIEDEIGVQPPELQERFDEVIGSLWIHRKSGCEYRRTTVAGEMGGQCLDVVIEGQGRFRFWLEADGEGEGDALVSEPD